MQVAFRTDASIQIGTGHVMRCLTLADALATKGAQCSFICREHTGNLIEYIRSKGHAALSLPMGQGADTDLAHSAWLGDTQAQDAQVCAPLLAELRPDWLVVDHYALDARWESVLGKYCRQIMIIDDLADRPHACKLLLDQTFERDAKDYRQLVPEGCSLLCGSKYALLRPEFSALRHYSLQRREKPQFKHLLITMGGVDKDNVTSQVLNNLRSCRLPADCKITLVMGATAPWLTVVQQQAKTMPWPTMVRVGVNNMAQLMADSDLVIGAAGSTSLESCCLGLPSIILVLAENQVTLAVGLARVGAAHVIGLSDTAMLKLAISIEDLCNSSAYLMSMSQAARTVVNGQGLDSVVVRLGV